MLKSLPKKLTGVAACITWDAIKSLKIKPGDQCVVVGASGEIGVRVVKFLKSRECHVTAVCSGASEAFVRELGADEVVDYTSQEFGETLVRKDHYCDTVFDCVGGRDIETNAFKCLKTSGNFVTMVGPHLHTGKEKPSWPARLQLMWHIIWRRMITRLTRGPTYRFCGTPPRLVNQKTKELFLKKRIIGYDLARALAIFGMVVVNFKTVMGAEHNGPEWLAGLIGLLDGRAAATFVVLAGTGLSLLSYKGRTLRDRDKLTENRRTLLKRALFLFIVGLLYTPIWPADILHFYGIYIAVGALLLAASARQLWSYSGLLVLTFVVMLFTLNYDQGWDWTTLDYEGFWTPIGMVRHLFYNGFHPVIPWLAFLLVGMLLGRQDMSNSAIRRRVFLWGAGVAVIAESVSWVLIHTLSTGASPVDQEAIIAIFGTEPMPPMPLYMLAGTGTACAVIAALIALGERYEGAVWLRPFVATGQLALTLYVAHVVLGMGILEAMGRLENQTLLFSLSASVVFCIAGVVFAHVWRSRFKRGPLEAIMRTLTDPKKKVPNSPL
jgi:uncharacterized membrane protein YeiB